MANSQIMVNMKFQADTTQAKAKMQELQQSLKSLQSLNSTNLSMGKTTAELQQAKNAAAQLSVQLKQAFNQDTGKLDLTRFNQSLKQSGMSLTKYQQLLSQAGPAGQKAFGQLATQIASADTNVIRISHNLQRLGATFANTVRYQISASAISAVTSTISQAVDFAEELNGVLNDIRIVSGENVEKMEEFASYANKAAKTLSTTTAEYAKASLIYFQQGLSEQQVKERTELTIKMANVTGQTAETVSDQLTAVWNNFDDGTKSLEYYVDVITALGAATASSSEEITEGLEKFAAVAETVGLSYEYATAALATVTATTRQSADVVGTAFKTLFARIQDLELGKELDDGTTLGQYSQALAAVGVNIKDVNGQVKDMNIILDEMGGKWKNLAKDQQIALAQNVAGVRQYTQLIALMDNWSYFQENLNTAMMSSGSLQEQADIYADSWEAAQNRVTTSLEKIYSSILEDDVFIDILDFFADLFENVGSVVEAMGGLKGVILALATAFVNLSRNSIAAGMSSMGATIMSWTAQGRQTLKDNQQQWYNAATTQYKGGMASDAIGNENLKTKIDLEKQFYNLTTNATDAEKAMLDIRRQSIIAETDKVEKAREELITQEQITKELELQLSKRFSNKSATVNGEEVTWNSFSTKAKQVSNSQALLNTVNIESYDDRVGKFNSGDFSDKSLGLALDGYSELQGKMEALNFGAEGAEQSLKDMFGESYPALQQYYESIVQTVEKIKELQSMSPEQRQQVQSNFQQQQQQYENDKQRMSELQGKNGQITRAKNRQAQGKTVDEKTTQAIKEYDQLEKRVKAYEKTNEKAIQGHKKASKEIKKQNIAVKEQGEALAATDKNVDKAQAGVNKFTGALKQESETMVTTTQNSHRLSKEANNLDKDFQNLRGPVTFSQKLTTMASMAMSAAMAITSLQSCIEIYKDADASFGDKIVQTMMSLGIVIPMVTSAFNKQNAAMLVGIATTKAADGSYKILNISKSSNVVITWMQKIAQDALNGSTLSTITLFGILAAAALVLIGVIVGVVAIVKAASDAWNKDAIAAKKAAERANELAEAYKNTKQAYDELKESIADYGEAQLAIAKLKKGTEEWRDAIEESNIKVMEMLDKYPELIDYIKSVDGQLKITDPQAVLDIYRNRTNTLYNASLDANLVAKNAKNRADKTNFIRTRGDFYTASDWLTVIGDRTLFGAATGAMAGSAAGGVGAIPGVVGGAAIGAVEGLGEAIYNNANAGDIMEDALTKISEAYQKDSSIFGNFEETLTTLGITNTELVDALITNKEEIIKLTRAEKDALNYEKQVKQQKVNNLLNSSGVHFGDNYTEHVQDLVTKKYDERVQQEIDKNYDSSNWHKTHWIWAQTGTDKGEAAAKNYADLMGYGSDFDVTDFEGDKIKFKYKKEGEDDFTKSEVTYAEMEKVLAEHAVSQSTAIAEYAARISSTISTLNNSENALAQGVGSFLAEGDLDYAILTEEQRQALANGTLEAVFPQGTDVEQVAKDFGYNTVGDMKTALQEALVTYDPAQAAANVARRTAQEIDAILAEGATALETTTDALEMYASSLMKTNPELEKNKKLAAQLAVQHFKTAKGLNGLQKAFEDNAEILKTADKNSLDYYEALGKLNQEIEKTFGVKVSASFLENEEHLRDLEKAANNDVEALARLKKAVNEDFILNLNINETTKEILSDKITELSNLALNSPIGTPLTLDDSQAIAALNEALYTGEATIDQIESMFNNANLQMPEYKTHWVDGEVTRSVSTTKTKGPFGIEYTTESETLTTAQKAIPYFGDKPPQVDTTTGKVTSYGGGGSLSVKTSGNKNSEANVLKYSGGDALKDKESKDLSKEVDRYKDINEELSDIERHLDKIGKAKDRAFGKAKVQLIQQEIDKQNELIDAENKYLSQIQDWYKKDWEKLDSRFKLGENGRIENYTSTLESLAAQVNNGISEEEYNKIKENADQYIETLNLLEEQQEKVNDETLRLKDLALEQITYEVEFEIEVNDRQIKYLEFLLGRLDDPIEDAVNAIKLLGDQVERNIKNIEAYKNGIKNIFTKSAGIDEEKVKQLFEAKNAEDIKNLNLFEGANFDEKDYDKIKQYVDSLYDAYESLESFYDNIMEKVNEAFEEYNNQAEEYISKVEFLNKVTDSYEKVIDLVGKKALGVSNEQIMALSKARVEQSKMTLEIKQGQLEFNKAARDAAQAELDAAIAAKDSEAIKHWEEQVEIIDNKVMEMETEVSSAWADTLQAIADDFTKAVELTVEEFEESMTGIYGSYEKMSDAFSQYQEVGDRYLSNYQKIYELNKLNRDINKSISDTDSIKGKQELVKLQEEINSLQESDTELSQYDLEYLQKKYDLRLAEIALEEAQNAKSQVRMRRDSEGNYSYVYTADENKTAEAAQNYEDKLYETMKHSQDYVDEMEAQWIQSNQDILEEIQSLRIQDFENVEEYEAAVNKIKEHYAGKNKYILDEMNKALSNSKTVYDEDWLNYSDYNGKRLEADSNWKTQFNETFGALTGGYTTTEEALTDFEDKCSKLMNKVIGKYTEWEQQVKNTFDIVDKDFDNFGKKGGTLDTDITKITDELNKVDSAFGEWKDSAESGFQSITTAAGNELKNFRGKMGEWKTELETLITQLETFLTLAGQEVPIPEVNTNPPEDVKTNTTDGGTSRSEDGSGNNTSENNDTTRAKVIQQYLNQSFDAGLTVDGIYGTQSKKAAKNAFGKDVTEEEAYNLIQNGYAYVKGDTSGTLSNEDTVKKIFATKKEADKYLTGLSETEKAKYEQMGYRMVSISVAGKYIEPAQKNEKKEEKDQDPPYEPGDLVTSLKYNEGKFIPVKVLKNGELKDAYQNWKFSGSTIGEDIIKDSNGDTYYNVVGIKDQTKTTGLLIGDLGTEYPVYVKQVYLNPASFDTGGYTGSWDSSGRLAMLHQKEIVLNAHDTENFLAAINIVRDIASAIDLRAAAYEHQLSSMAYAYSAGGAPQMLQQDVTIHAEFPNVRERSEIEAAFDNLINRASQFANRKNI